MVASETSTIRLSPCRYEYAPFTQKSLHIFFSFSSTIFILNFSNYPKALQEVPESNSNWNRTAARAYIESRQDPDGAFTDPGLTADALMALLGKGLGAIRTLDCGKLDPDFDNHGNHFPLY